MRLLLLLPLPIIAPIFSAGPSSRPNAVATGVKPIQKVLLVGNPNVGKSVIFGRITGRYVIVSNYPGTTVEISKGNLKIEGWSYELIDTPGINGLVPQSEDEKVTRDLILQERPNVIVQIADAKNIRRALYLTLQLAEFGIPMILNLNMIDENHSRGIEIDTAAIENTLGIPVNTSIATMDVGIQPLIRLIPQARVPRQPVEFDARVLAPLQQLVPRPIPPALCTEWLLNEKSADIQAVRQFVPADTIQAIRETVRRLQAETRHNLADYFDQERNRYLNHWVPSIKRLMPAGASQAGVPRRHTAAMVALTLGIAIHLANLLLPLAGYRGPLQWLSALADGWARPALSRLFLALGQNALGAVLFTGPDGLGLLFGRYGLVHPGCTVLLCFILPVALPFLYALKRIPGFPLDFDRMSRRKGTGLLILLLFLSVIYAGVGFLGAQVLVGFFEHIIFGRMINPLFAWVIRASGVPPIIDALFTGEYGLLSMGLTYALAIVFPVVTAFFLFFGFMEDSGYLPRLAILVNRIFRVMGLSGKAVLPMVLGLGCGTMATMTARILHSRKERLIATLLLALGVPCSAQLGVILGIFAGHSLAVLGVVLGVVLGQLLLVGFLAGRLLPGESSDFILEIPPIRSPLWKNIWLKTRLRVVWFLKEAVPLFLLGTLVLFAMDRLLILERLTRWSKPVVVHFLGLPAESARIFVMGFLRRDYGAAGLFELVQQGRLDGNQVAVALIVLTLFIPCVANFFIIIKEQGWKKALAIVGFIIPLAVITGGLVNLVLRYFTIHL